MKAKKHVKGINFVEPNNLSISLDAEGDLIVLNLRNTRFHNVIPERPFPVSDPVFVILKDVEGNDICTIRDTGKLDKKSRENLEKILNRLYFIPKITRINELDSVGDKFEWDTETKKGKRKFTTRGRDSIIFIGKKIIISDIDDNIYQIENVSALDTRSTNMIQSTF